ncbi:MAG: RsmB/NOP family class I SAM-dependent RNA methyltransferase [Archangium sp.]|nr:RsmB/NOP family class I SAM-dependent RNA methyltransferase [Archangium sp.]
MLDGEPADRVLDRTLRANRSFSAAQRQVTAEALFGVGLWRRRLRAQTTPDASPATLLAALVADLGASPDIAHLLDGALQLTPLSDWRDEWSVPSWLADELSAAVGDEAPRLAEALNSPGPVCLRPNARRTSTQALHDALTAAGISTRRGEWATDALICTSPRPNILGLELFHQGHFEVQDEGSQLAGALLPFPPGATVLDLCAGAGGKTLQLASRGAQVHAYDVDRAKLERLRQRTARAGVAVSIHHQLPTREFDAVFIDAPCSELGALRRGPDLRWRMDPSTLDAWCETNAALLDTAFTRTRPGGHIAYVTCTFRRAENESVVDAFLARTPSAKRVGNDVALFPHRHGTDGFYAALLQRAV